jgi:hypothetical protein
MQKQIDTSGVNFRQESDKVLKAVAKAIDRPRHNNVELTTRGSFMQSIERWPLVLGLCARNAVILVDPGLPPGRPGRLRSAPRPLRSLPLKTLSSAGVANSGNAVIGLYPRRLSLPVMPTVLLVVCAASLRVLRWACLGIRVFFLTKPRWQVI